MAELPAKHKQLARHDFDGFPLAHVEGDGLIPTGCFQCLQEFPSRKAYKRHKPTCPARPRDSQKYEPQASVIGSMGPAQPTQPAQQAASPSSAAGAETDSDAMDWESTDPTAPAPSASASPSAAGQQHHSTAASTTTTLADAAVSGKKGRHGKAPQSLAELKRMLAEEAEGAASSSTAGGPAAAGSSPGAGPGAAPDAESDDL